MTTAQAHTLLDAALAYAATGWHVFPAYAPTENGCSCRHPDCDDIGKHPRTQHGLSDATTDEAQIRKWWTMWPQANIAIRTGAVSGLVVLDVDFRKGGAESLTDLEQSYHPLPETVLDLTGNGQHYFFAHPGQYVKTGTEDFAPGLDIRGDGGYVIAAPSLHANGKRYTWEILHEPDETPLAPLPEWLLALCQEQTQRAAPSAGEPIPKGQRNDTLFRLGCGFRARGCTEAVIVAALLEMNATQCQPPLPEEDIRKIAASCAKFAPGTTRTDPQHRRNGSPPPQATDGAQDATEEDYPYSDAYNALCLVRTHGQDMRYCAPWKSWLTWTGTHWQRDTIDLVLRWQRQTVKALGAQVATLDDDAAKKLMGHIKSSLNTSRLKAAVDQAHSWEGMTIAHEALDADVWLLNCANGTLDLRTGTLRPHLQSDLLTKCLTIPYDPAATCPTWEAFLWRIMGGSQGKDSPDMRAGELENRRVADARAVALIAFLRRAIGYSLTGSTREQCLFILHGPTKTGKSTFLATLRALLGPYGQQADMESFMHKEKQEVRNDLADLAGSRFVCALEGQEGRRLAENLIKQLTGGTDMVKARFLFQEHFTFKPQFKVFLGSNHKPVIKDTDSAIWERVRLVPFTVQIPKEERDKTLDERLQAELSGILNWALHGCLTWQQLGELQEPEAVVDATATYRSEMDNVARFIEERCLLSPHVRVKAGDLYAAYKKWCEESGEHAITLTAMGKRLDDKGIEKKPSGGSIWRLGIGLVQPTEDAP
jgi:putative DNA primase/helicase